MANENELIIYTKISPVGVVAGTKEVEDACRKAAESVKGIGESAQKGVDKALTAIEKQNRAYAEQTEKVRALQRQLDAESGRKVETAEYAELNAELDRLNEKLAVVDAKKKRFIATGGKEDSTAFKKLNYDANVLIDQYDILLERKRQLEQSGGAYTGADTTKLQASLSSAQAKQGDMGTRLDKSVKSYADAIDKYRKSASKAKSASNGLKTAFTAVGRAAKTVGSAILRIAKTAFSAFLAAAKKCISAIGTLVKKFATFGKSNGGMGNGIKTMLKYALGVRSLYALVNKLKSALTEGMGNLKTYSNAVNQSISSMQNAVTRLENSVAAAFSPILSVVAPIVTKLINLLATAISYIGAFFAALSGKSTYTRAVAATESVAGAMGDAADAAGGAADKTKEYLSGLDEISKFDDKASGGGGGGGGSSGGSTGVQFEEAAIPGMVSNWADKFRESWENADFTDIGTTVGAKLKTALDSIDWAGIQAKCNKIATSVATFINGFFGTAGLWETVGRTIGTGLNTAVGMYNKFMNTTDFVNIGTAIATSLNEAILNVSWGSVGEAIMQKFNAVIDLLYGFVTTLSWENIAYAISEFLSGAIANVDAQKLGTTVATIINGLVTVILGLVQSSPTSGLTAKLKEFINTAITNIDVNNLKAAIQGVVKAACSLLGELFGSGSTVNVADGIIDLIGAAVEAVDGDALWSTFDAFTNVLTDLLIEAISHIDILWVTAVLVDLVFGIIGAALAAIFRLIPGVGDDIADKIVAFVDRDLSGGYLRDKAERAGEGLGEAYSDGVKDGIDGATEAGEQLGAGACAGAEGATAGAVVAGAQVGMRFAEGAAGTTGTATETGAQVGAGFNAGAGSSGADATLTGSQVGQRFAEGAAGTTGQASEAGALISDSTVGAMRGTGEYTEAGAAVGAEYAAGVGSSVDTIGASAADAYNSGLQQFGTASTDFTQINDDIVSAFDTLPNKVSNKFKSAYTKSKSQWSSAGADFSKISANISNSFSSLGTELKSTFSTALSDAANSWNGATTSFRQISAQIVGSFTSLSSGVKIKFTTALTSATGAWSTAKTKFSTISDNIASAFNTLPTKVKSHFQSACNGITTLNWSGAGTSAATSVVNGMYTVSPYSWGVWFVGQISLNGYSTGYYLTRGIINGMYTTSGLGNWATWFTNQVKSSLGIASPSKLFRDEVGIYLGEGIGVGLERSTGGILHTISGIAEKIIDGFADMVSGITLDAPTFADPVFPSVSYRQPLLASGTIIPPKATYSAREAGKTQDVMGELESIVGLLKTMVSPQNGGEQSNRVIHNVIQINRHTLFEEMRKEAELVESQSGGW